MLDVKGKRVLVMGLGRSGIAAVGLLLARGAVVSVSDSAASEDVEERLGDLREGISAFQAGRHDREFCSDAEIVIMSPGIDHARLLRQGILSPAQRVIGELELAWQLSRGYVIAVTGTNGKSTTASLIAEMLRASGKDVLLCGNIGTPMSAVVPFLTEESVSVVEVSSFQLETVADFAPDVALVLNITPDHLDRHGSFHDYVRIKSRILARQGPESWAVVHSSLKEAPFLNSAKTKRVLYGAGMDGTGQLLVNSPAEPARNVSIPVDDIHLKGAHNLDNVEGAALAAFLGGAVPEGILRAAISFRPLEHRCRSIAVIDGVEFIDDSKATNTDAAKKALSALEVRCVLIAGGRDKGEDYGRVLPEISEKARAVVVFGEASSRLRDAFGRIVPVICAESMTEAVEAAFAAARTGDAVLLSPMCSSFDMYRDYAHRGDMFIEAVNRISERLDGSVRR